jgi:hypothetical protein
MDAAAATAAALVDAALAALDASVSMCKDKSLDEAELDVKRRRRCLENVHTGKSLLS